MKVCFSGTFNVLHKGHKYLIKNAIQNAGEDGKVFIGVTEEEMLTKKKYVIPFSDRVNAIKEYLKKEGFLNNVIVKSINNKYGEATDGDFDAIVVSPETIENAEEINKKRIENNKKPLKIIKISHILAEDNKPISSTRILNKEIDEEGRILTH